ncbi:MAG TPA: hypothetical protein VEO54_29250 [Thermoanaerobaculia bacterium]|nr:hypothetical protein [Thermoanaerobaculia bacterium]
MKKLMMILGIVASFAMAAPLFADGPCKSCEERWLWPWLEDCWFCEDAECGAVLCHIEQWESGEVCIAEGSGCGEGNPNCTDEEWQDIRFEMPQPGVRVARACERPLSESWRLTEVRVSSPRGKRAGSGRA